MTDDLPAHEVEEAWREMMESHLAPSRIFRLALGMNEDAEARDHLESCESCRRAYYAYLLD